MKFLFPKIVMFLLTSLLVIKVSSVRAMEIIVQVEKHSPLIEKTITDRLVKKFFIPKSRIHLVEVSRCQKTGNFRLEWCLKKTGDLVELPNKNNSLIKTSLLVFRRIKND